MLKLFNKAFLENKDSAIERLDKKKTQEIIKGLLGVCLRRSFHLHEDVLLYLKLRYILKKDIEVLKFFEEASNTLLIRIEKDGANIRFKNPIYSLSSSVINIMILDSESNYKSFEGNDIAVRLNELRKIGEERLIGSLYGNFPEISLLEKYNSARIKERLITILQENNNELLLKTVVDIFFEKDDIPNEYFKEIVFSQDSSFDLILFVINRMDTDYIKNDKDFIKAYNGSMTMYDDDHKFSETEKQISMRIEFCMEWEG